MKEEFISSYSLTAFTKFGMLILALFSLAMLKGHIAYPDLYYFFGLGPIVWAFNTLFFGNLYYFALKRKIIVTSDGIINEETPMYLLGRTKKKIPEKIKWSDIKELTKTNDLLLRGFMTYYTVITHDNKKMFFTSFHYPKVKDLIAYIEVNTGKEFRFADSSKILTATV